MLWTKTDDDATISIDEARRAHLLRLAAVEPQWPSKPLSCKPSGGFQSLSLRHVTVNFDDYVAGVADSFAFSSTMPHRLRNAGDLPAQAIWVVVGRHRWALGLL